MSKILLETINLKKNFEHLSGTVTLFNNINLKIKEGDLVALVVIWFRKIIFTTFASLT